MRCPRKLNEVFPQGILGNGIFTTLQLYNIPWASENIDNFLDMEYYGNISSDKYIAPLVDKLCPDVAGSAERNSLAQTIIAIYGKNWAKQWATQQFEYNPIENYSMTESMKDDKTVVEYGKNTTRTDDLTHEKTGTDTTAGESSSTRTDDLTHAKTGTDITAGESSSTRTDDLTHAKTGTDTRTDDLTATNTPNLTVDNTDKIHGFNSAEGVPSAERIQVSSGNAIVANTGTQSTAYNTQDKDSGTQKIENTDSSTTTYNTQDKETGTQTVENTDSSTTTYNTQDKETGTQQFAESGTDAHTRNYELTRSGNIGVTTSQQMIESERALWIWNFFHDIVFPDVDRILCLKIY